MNKQKLNFSLISTILALAVTSHSASASIVNWQNSQQISPLQGANFYLLGMTNNSILAAENSVVTIPFAGASNAAGQTSIESDSEAIRATLDNNSLIVVVNEVDEDMAVNLRVVDEQNTEYAITINVVNDPTFAIDNYDSSLFTSINIGDTVIRDTRDWLETDYQPMGVQHLSYGRTASLQPGFTQALPTVGQYYSDVGNGLLRRASYSSPVVDSTGQQGSAVAPLAFNIPDGSSISDRGLFLTGQEKAKAVSTMQHRQIRFEPKPSDQEPMQTPTEDDDIVRAKVNEVIGNLGNDNGQENNQGGNGGNDPTSTPVSGGGPAAVPVVPDNSPNPNDPVGGNTPNNNGTLQPVAIPTPATWTLFGLALAGIAFTTRKSPSVVG